MFDLNYGLVTPSDQIEYWWENELLNFTIDTSCSPNSIPSPSEAYTVFNSFMKYLYGREIIKDISGEPNVDVSFCISTLNINH